MNNRCHVPHSRTVCFTLKLIEIFCRAVHSPAITVHVSPIDVAESVMEFTDIVWPLGKYWHIVVVVVGLSY